MKFTKTLVSSMLILATGGVMASSNDCSYHLNYVQTGSMSLEDFKQKYPECFAGSSPASTQQVSATSFQQISAISSGVGSRLLNGGGQGPRNTAALSGTGMAAGSTGGNWNVWGNLSDSTASYTAMAGNTNMNTRSDTFNTVVGADTNIASDLVVGASVAIDNSSSRLNATTSGNANGHSIAPYVGWQINKKLALDATVGLGFGQQSQTGGSKTDSTRIFYAANLNYAEWISNWQFTGKAGYLSAQERFTDSRLNGAAVAGTSSTSSLDQVRVGVEAGYWLDGGFMPYVGVTYTNDINRTRQALVPWDGSAFLLSAGVNFYSLKNGITGGISYSAETNRTYSTNSTLMANVSLRF